MLAANAADLMAWRTLVPVLAKGGGAEAAAGAELRQGSRLELGQSHVGHRDPRGGAESTRKPAIHRRRHRKLPRVEDLTFVFYSLSVLTTNQPRLGGHPMAARRRTTRRTRSSGTRHGCLHERDPAVPRPAASRP